MLYLVLYGSSARTLVHVSFTSVPRIPAAMCSCLIIISSQLLGTRINAVSLYQILFCNSVFSCNNTEAKIGPLNL